MSKRFNKQSVSNFNDVLPRSIFAEVDPKRLDKTANTFTGVQGAPFMPGLMGNAGNILRNPTRRFYHPEFTTTAIYLPRDLKQKNRWRRWFFDHDEVVGTILEIHAELPYSAAEIEEEDPYIKRYYEDCLDKVNFFSMLPIIDLEFLKIGEVFIHTPWDATNGMWNNIIIHNPDFVNVKFSPFADQDCVIELIPDDEVKSLVHSTKPEEQALKKKLPPEIVKRILTGKNIILNSEETTHIARRSNPYDVRGTSIIDRLFRCFIPGTQVRMSDGTCKEIENVSVGDFVLSKNGEKREVIDTVQYNIKDKLIELVPEKSFNTLKSTIGHKYLIQRAYCACGCGGELTSKQINRHAKLLHGHNLKFNTSLNEDGKDIVVSDPIYKIEEVESQNIKVGDCLLVPINNEVGECSITEDQARLLGYFLAEGSFGNENTEHQSYIEWTFGIHERSTWAEDVIRILETEFDISPNVYPGFNGKNVFLVRVVRRSDYEKLHTFLRDNINGNRAWNKSLKEKVLYYPKNVQKQLLIGAFRGDGTYNKNYTETIYNTTSKDMAEQFQWLLFRCKYYSYIKHWDFKPSIIDKRYNKPSVKRRLYWVRITGNYSKDFIRECWDDFKIIKLVNTELYETIKESRDSGHSWTRIANDLNASGLKGIEGGSFYNVTVKRIFEQGGNVLNYQFSRDRIRNDENYFYVPIKKIHEIKYSGIVHDITVKDNHWWLCDGSKVTSNTLMYEDKLREAQITISDNFIYPLKLFKLGDPQRGWIPSESHQRALAQMLQQATFDPNFALIYHYALNVEYVTVADKVMKLDREWDEINKKKAVALGISQQFLTGDTTYACFVEGTNVSTPDGFKNIELIKIGDTVLDINNNVKKVIDNWNEGIPEEVLKIELENGVIMECTHTHRFPIFRKREVIKLKAIEITLSDSFISPSKEGGNIFLNIKEISSIRNSKKVYNLTVEDTHSYQVAGGVATYNSANVGLQTQLARYRAKRDLFEERFIKDKFFKVMAQRNGWYRRDKREIQNNFRVSRSEREIEDRLIVPNLVWNKKLMLRDDQSYLTFLNQVYQNGKGPISPITLLQAMGLDLQDELKKKKRSKSYEKMYGANIHPPVGGAAGLMGGITAKAKGLLKFGKNKESNLLETTLDPDQYDVEEFNDMAVAPVHDVGKVTKIEKTFDDDVASNTLPSNDNTWYVNLESPAIPAEVVLLMSNYKNKLDAINKKYPNDLDNGLAVSKLDILRYLMDIYLQGKLTSYNWTDFLPVYKEHYSMNGDFKDYSDLLINEEIDSWTDKVIKNSSLNGNKLNVLRNMSINAFAYGQLKGFQEQGIYNVKVSNVLANDGVRYKIGELLIKGSDLGAIVSPRDEIIMFAPCIENFDEFDNNVDPHISRYKDFYANDISVRGCPVEYHTFINRFCNKLGKYIKRKYSSIEFVKDIVDLPDWEENQRKRFSDEFSNIDKNSRQMLISNAIMMDKTQKRGKVPVFGNSKKLYIANWIGSEDISIIDNLIRYIDIFEDESLVKDVRKSFKKINYDLNSDEINTYKIFGYIEPLSGDEDNPRGYKVSSHALEKNNEIDSRIINGRIWNVNGKCIHAVDKDPISLFKENLKLWIDYPHLMDKEILNYFNTLE